MTDMTPTEFLLITQPRPCVHGVQPIVETEMLEQSLAGPFAETVSGRMYLSYGCPTPYECGTTEAARLCEAARVSVIDHPPSLR